jgi:SAM-dependent methyltransferase
MNGMPALRSELRRLTSRERVRSMLQRTGIQALRGSETAVAGSPTQPPAEADGSVSRPQLSTRARPAVPRDAHRGPRAVSYRDGNSLIKAFHPNADGRLSFETEVRAATRLSAYDWMPRLQEVGDLWYRREFYAAGGKAHFVSQTMDARLEVARRLLAILLDLYCEGVAHRDVHLGNVFEDRGKPKLVDYEHCVDYDQWETPSFLASYDITGRGLPSPHETKHAGFASDAAHSVCSGLGVPFDGIWNDVRSEELGGDLFRRLKEACATFQTVLTNRHSCSASRIYSSFSLPDFEVSPDVCQRNTRRRLERFGINSEDIRGRRVLDLGCNVGAVLFECSNYQPQSCTGVEYDREKILVARRIAALNELTNVRFINEDIDALETDEEFDVTFCLAINRHVKNEPRLFETLARATRELLLFECNSGSDTEHVMRQLERVGFSRITPLGPCDDDCVPRNNDRELIRAVRAG